MFVDRKVKINLEIPSQRTLVHVSVYIGCFVDKTSFLINRENLAQNLTISTVYCPSLSSKCEIAYPAT